MNARRIQCSEWWLAAASLLPYGMQHHITYQVQSLCGDVSLPCAFVLCAEVELWSGDSVLCEPISCGRRLGWDGEE